MLREFDDDPSMSILKNETALDPSDPWLFCELLRAVAMVE